MLKKIGMLVGFVEGFKEDSSEDVEGRVWVSRSGKEIGTIEWVSLMHGF